MSSPLQQHSEPWGFDPTCTRTVFQTPSGEHVGTIIPRHIVVAAAPGPQEDGAYELAARGARRGRRLEILKAAGTLSAILMLLFWIAR